MALLAISTPIGAGGLAGAMYGGQGGQEEAEEKRELEHSLTFSMLGVRMAEMRGAWTHNQHDLMAALIQVIYSIFFCDFGKMYIFSGRNTNGWLLVSTSNFFLLSILHIINCLLVLT